MFYSENFKWECARPVVNGAIGTGPYVLKEKTRATQLFLAKKLEVSGPGEIRFLATNSFGNFEKLKGAMDLILVNSEIGEVPNFNKHRYSRFGNWQFSFNNQSHPFSDSRLRESIVAWS